MSIGNVQFNTLLQLFNLKALIDYFKYSKTFETGLSDYNELISTTVTSDSFKGPSKKKEEKKSELQMLQKL